jgi:PBP1b-binding outer membrane lipoprotein LpoB
MEDERMNNRTTILLMSAVLIASVLSGCVQEKSEIESPDADQPAPASEVTSLSMSAPPSIVNWKYVSYRNLSISNAPALNQTARVTYSIVPDKDIEVLLVHISFFRRF